MMFALEPAPSSSTRKEVSATWFPWVMSFSVTMILAPSASLALVRRLVESTPLIWTVSISMKLFSPTSTLVSGFIMRPPLPSPLP